MPALEINVNKADINSARSGQPLDLMGLLFFAYRDFVRDADALLAKQGFGRAHHRVLYFVNRKPGMTVAELLDILRITKQSLARVLRQLVESDYIEQITGPTDRRQRLLYPTAKGVNLIGTLTDLQASRVSKALDALPPDGHKLVARFLEQMVQPEDRKTLDDLHLTDVLKDYL